VNIGLFLSSIFEFKVTASIRILTFCICCFLPLLSVCIVDTQKLKLKKEVDLPFPNQPINDVLIDKKGYTYIIRTDDVLKYDGKKFFTFPWSKKNHDDLIRGKFCHGTLYIYDFLGRIFYLKNDTLRPYQNNDLLPEYNPYHHLVDFYFDEADTLHISFQNSSYLKISPDGVLCKPLIEAGFEPSAIICILKSPNDPFLVGSISRPITGKNTFYLLDSNFQLLGKTEIARRCYYLPPSLIKFDTNYCYSTGKGQLVMFSASGIEKTIPINRKIGRMANYGKSAWISDPEFGILFTKNWLDGSFEIEYVFPGKSLYVAVASSDSFAWAYSTEGKLYQIRSTNPIPLHSLNRQIVDESVNSFSANGNRIYLATNKDSLYELDRDGNFISSASIPENINNYREILALNERLYSADRGSISYRLKGSTKWQKVQLPRVVYSFHPRSIVKFFPLKDQLFASHNRYLFTLKDDRVDSVYNLFESNITEVVTFHNDLIVQTENNLIQLTDSSRLTLLDFDTLQSFLPLEIKSTDSLLWLLYRNKGLSWYDGIDFKEIDSELNSLLNSIILYAKDNKLITLGEAGLISIEKKKNGKFDLQQFSSPNMFDRSNFWIWEDEIYWNIDEEGLVKNKIEDLLFNHPQPNIIDLRLKLDGTSFIEKGQKIPANHNYLQVIFESTCYSSSDVNYRYKIHGLVDNWQHIDSEVMQISQLEGGDYTFELQARRNKEAWSESSMISFNVLTSFYESWWFITACILLIALSIRYYSKKKLQWAIKENELEMDKVKTEQLLLRTQMNPHFISNTIASVQYLILKKRNKEANSFLSSFSMLMRKTFAYSRLERVSILDEIEFLNNFLELNKSKADGRLDFKISLNENVPQHTRIPTFLIQPFVENALHHGIKNSSKIGKISLHIENAEKVNFIRAKITDSGVGIDSKWLSEKRLIEKNGSLAIVIKRLQKLNGQNKQNVSIQVLKNAQKIVGTEVSVLIKTTYYESPNNR